MTTKRDFAEHFLIFGIPCAGKGFTLKVLHDIIGRNIQTIEMGENFRREIANKTQIGRTIEKTVWDGYLLEDKYARAIIDRYDLAIDTIIDGYPRTISQAREYLARILELRRAGHKINPMIIHVMVTIENAIERMGFRIANSINTGDAIRPDDKLEILIHRINESVQHTTPALEYLRLHGIPVLDFDGNIHLRDNRDPYMRALSEFISQNRKTDN